MLTGLSIEHRRYSCGQEWTLAGLAPVSSPGARGRAQTPKRLKVPHNKGEIGHEPEG